MGEGEIMSEDMTPFQQKPVVNMDDAMLELQNFLSLATLELQRFAGIYREAGKFELAEFTTKVICDLDHRFKLLRFIPAEYQRRMKDNSI